MKLPPQVSIQNLELHLLGSDATFSVAEFVVTQAISVPFRVSLIIRADSDFSVDAVMGEMARFDVWYTSKSVFSAERPLSWTGYVVCAEDIGGDTAGHRLFRVEIASPVWALSQNRNYRVFQNVSEIDIVCQIFDEWGIPWELEVDVAAYKPLKYRVQHAESDLAFVQRNLEEVGVSFVLEEQNGQEVVRITDEPHCDDPRSSLLYVESAPQHGLADWARNVKISRRVRPGRYLLQDLDYRTPPTRPLRVGAQSQDVSALEQSLERFHFTPGFAHRVVDEVFQDTPVADDRSTARVDKRFAEFIARMRLEAKQSDRWRVTFETNALDVFPGVVVPIINHDSAELAEPLLVVAASFSGTDIGVWHMECEAVPANTPFRPLLKTRKPRSGGLESATVVGPDGAEIHTDEFGRVRVQFHWDRVGTYDERSSCWVPVSETWAGTGYGSVHLPRVGHEVLVDFLGGDLDKPIIVGRVYTRVQPVPYKLPENQTVTVIAKTKTVGGDGYNEIKADDKPGAELLSFRAQRDHETLVLREERRTVGVDRITKIGKHDTLEIAGVETRVFTSNKPNAPVTVQTFTNASNKIQVGTTRVECTPGKIFMTTGAGASITLEGSGIKIEAATVEIVGTGQVDVKGKPINIHADGAVVDVKGSTIQLNC